MRSINKIILEYQRLSRKGTEAALHGDGGWELAVQGTVGRGGR